MKIKKKRSYKEKEADFFGYRTFGETGVTENKTSSSFKEHDSLDESLGPSKVNVGMLRSLDELSFDLRAFRRAHSEEFSTEESWKS